MRKEMTTTKGKHSEHTATAENVVARRAWDPTNDWQQRASGLFQNIFTGFDSGDELFLPSLGGIGIRSEVLSPRFDLSETDDAFEVTAELPGMEEKDIDVSVENGILTVKGEKKEECEKRERNYYLAERRYGSFQRTFSLPGLDWEKAKACFKKGVLCLTLPKTPEAKTHRMKIEVNS